MLTFYWSKKLQDVIEIGLLIICGKKGFCKDHLPLFKIKPDHHYRHRCFFCNMIETRSQPVHFFSGTLRRKTDDELLFTIEHLRYLVNKAALMRSVNRDTTEPAKNKTKRPFEKFLLTKELESLQVKHFSESETHDDVSAACMWRHDNDGLF
jgi:hypothetical protein